MRTLKSFKPSYGIVALLAIGLSSCLMDGMESRDETQAPQHVSRTHAHNAAAAAEHTQRSEAAGTSHAHAKEPVQKTTPGPKRTAAPQIPVIQ